MGTNSVPLVADLFTFCYERDGSDFKDLFIDEMVGS